MQPYIAIVDDEPEIRRLCRAIAESAAFRTGEYKNGADFFSRYTPQPGCIVLDLDMPHMGGVEVLEEMQRRGWRVPTIVILGTPPKGGVQPLLDLGAIAVLQKPFAVAELLSWIERATSPTTDQSASSNGHAP